MSDAVELISPNERYVLSLSAADLAASAARYVESARVHIDNYRQFREDPNGNADGNQDFRCKFWFDMTMQSLSDADAFIAEMRKRQL